MASGACLACAAESEPAPVAPWQTNRPIVRVSKQLYKPHPGPRAAMLVSMQHVGPGLQRREVQGAERESDVAHDLVARWSSDNGRNWSDFVPVQPSNKVKYKDVGVWEGEGASACDPVSGLLVRSWLS